MDEILTRYSTIEYARLISTIGKRVEGFKVQMRRLKLDLDYRKDKNNLNDTDLFLLKEGEAILNKGWWCINLLNNIDYLSLIKRSMNSNEICLGKTDGSNLRKTKYIEIGKLKNASYNLLEEDVYVFLKKLKNKDKGFKGEYYIDEFINKNKLSRDSKEYIEILLQFPSETFRQWMRYKNGKKNITPEEYLLKIKNALEYER